MVYLEPHKIQKFSLDTFNLLTDTSERGLQITEPYSTIIQHTAQKRAFNELTKLNSEHDCILEIL